MTLKYEVTTNATEPETEAVWTVRFADGEEAPYTYYRNLADDLIAAVMVKLGQEFSKYKLDNDGARLNAEL